MSLIYDSTSKESICKFAKRLEGLTVAQALSKYKMYQGVIVEDSSNIGEKEYSGKGSFGQYLEEVFLE